LNLSDASIERIKQSLPEAKQKKFQEVRVGLVRARLGFSVSPPYTHPSTVDYGGEDG
jgi:hypothetical protein